MTGTFPHRNHAPKMTCQSFPASFHLMPNRRLRISFLKKGLSPVALQYYFANQQFVMPFDFDLPQDLMKILGADHYRIQAGVYKIQDDNEYIIIDV